MRLPFVALGVVGATASFASLAPLAADMAAVARVGSMAVDLVPGLYAAVGPQASALETDLGYMATAVNAASLGAAAVSFVEAEGLGGAVADLERRAAASAVEVASFWSWLRALRLR